MLWTAKEKNQNWNWRKLAGNQRKERILVLKDKISSSKHPKTNARTNCKLLLKSIKLQAEKVFLKHRRSKQAISFSSLMLQDRAPLLQPGPRSESLSFWAWSGSFRPLLLKSSCTWQKKTAQGDVKTTGGYSHVLSFPAQVGCTKCWAQAQHPVHLLEIARVQFSLNSWALSILFHPPSFTHGKFRFQQWFCKEIWGQLVQRRPFTDNVPLPIHVLRAVQLALINEMLMMKPVETRMFFWFYLRLPWAILWAPVLRSSALSTYPALLGQLNPCSMPEPGIRGEAEENTIMQQGGICWLQRLTESDESGIKLGLN